MAGSAAARLPQTREVTGMAGDTVVEGGFRASAAPEPVSLWGHPLSVTGLALVIGGAVLIVLFLVSAAISPITNPYFDIVGFMVLPGIFMLGLMITPIGVALKYRRIRRSAGTQSATFRLPQFDFNDRAVRRRVIVFVLVSFFVVFPLIAVSSYEGYHYTESTDFCAKACHSVMEPQGVAHATSPHARVTCAECHIGSGADWFVKSKISGARQVLAVWLETYSRPIPPAITELRPARDTCEQCHWPTKFFGSQFREYVHYSPDEENTRRVVKMLLHVGGADDSIGRVEGIHMHMLTNGRIEYIAADEHLQEIPWVRYVRPDGREVIYRSDGRGAADPPPPGTRRVIDCMDCHNRGAHHFRSPQKAADIFLEVGKIDPQLPFIKREAVEALATEYADVESATQDISARLTRFYRENYPELWGQRREWVERSVAGVVEAYRQNIFPRMKVDWRAYPENIGHLESAGCFRCHDGKHVSDAGEVISADCDACHSVMVPVAGTPGAIAPGEFVHSMMLQKHATLRCDQCHTGGPLLLCRECHASGEWLDQRTLGPVSPHSTTLPATSPSNGN